MEFIKINYPNKTSLNLSYDVPEILDSLKFNSKGYIPKLDFKSLNSDGGKLWRNIWMILDLPNFSKISPSIQLTIFTWIPQLIYLILLYDLEVNLELFRDLHKIQNSKELDNILTDDALIDEYSRLLLEQRKLLTLISIELREFIKAVKFKRLERIYCGYDTEYQVIDSRYNDLISRQLASTSTLGLQIANFNFTFDFSKSRSGIGDFYLTKDFNNLNKIPNLLFSFKLLFGLLKLGVEDGLLISNLLDNYNLVKELKGNNITYFLPMRTNPEAFLTNFKYFKEGEGYSMEELINEIKLELSEYSVQNRLKFHEILSCEDFDKIYKQFFNRDTMISHECFLISHFSIADLSILKDFQKFKRKFDILRGSLASCQKPLRLKGLKIYLRDTANLSDIRTPLTLLGESYNFPKLNLLTGLDYNPYNFIRKFSIEHPKLFQEYGLRDSLITLIHGLTLQEFSFSNLGEYSVPNTIASLARKTTLKLWNNLGLTDFNRLGEYHLADFRNTFSSKGIQAVGNVATILPYFLGVYRGGRNESFAYGLDKEFKWYDYDLTGAYTTAISSLGIPDYYSTRHLTSSNLLNNFWNLNVYYEVISSDSNQQLIWKHCYGVFRVNFNFPESINKPCIPVHLDGTNTVYPLSGNNILVTLHELKVALDMNCEIDMLDAWIVPFKGTRIKDSNNLNYIFPYQNILKQWSVERSKYLKGSPYNLLYKLIGNSLYGQVSTGLNNKRRFDARLGVIVDNNFGNISNPFIAQAISGFVRATLSETLNYVDKQGGKIISCTTDGFITDIAPEIFMNQNYGSLSTLFKQARFNLVGKLEIYELAYEGTGLVSWRTRGQLGLGNSNLSAITGFQSKYLTQAERQSLLTNLFNSNIKEHYFLQHSLRKAKEIWVFGGSVISKVLEMVFSLRYDNRRQLNTNISFSSFIFSTPFLDTKSASFIRLLDSIGKPTWAGKFSYIPNTNLKVNSKVNFIDFTINQLIRGYYQGHLTSPLSNPFFNHQNPLFSSRLTYLQFSMLLNDLGIERTPLSISQINIAGSYYPNKVPNIPLTLEIISKIQVKLPGLLLSNFFELKSTLYTGLIEALYFLGI